MQVQAAPAIRRVSYSHLSEPIVSYLPWRPPYRILKGAAILSAGRSVAHSAVLIDVIRQKLVPKSVTRIDRRLMAGTNRIGTCTLKRIVCAQGMGRVVNPEGAKMQMEGVSHDGTGICPYRGGSF